MNSACTPARLRLPLCGGPRGRSQPGGSGLPLAVGRDEACRGRRELARRQTWMSRRRSQLILDPAPTLGMVPVKGGGRRWAAAGFHAGSASPSSFCQVGRRVRRRGSETVSITDLHSSPGFWSSSASKVRKPLWARAGYGIRVHRARRAVPQVRPERVIRDEIPDRVAGGGDMTQFRHET